jgi:hypothetical protein
VISLPLADRIAAAHAVLGALALYCAVGVVSALIFLGFRVRRALPGDPAVSLAARALLFPAAAALWPVILVRSLLARR